MHISYQFVGFGSKRDIIGIVILANLIGYFAARSLATIMGIIRSCFSFIAGNVFGIYIAQNYQVPNLKKVADNVLLRAKEVDRKYRKPKKKGGDDE